jgi:hypothetical protein
MMGNYTVRGQVKKEADYMYTQRLATKGKDTTGE